MKVTRRTYGLSVLGFGLVSVLMLGGLAWATTASLRLERFRAESRSQERHQEVLNRAMGRMENPLIRMLGHEDQRDYSHYRWSYCSTDLLPGGCIGPSPIVLEEETGKIPDWVLLHFQVSRAEGWQSPEGSGGAVERFNLEDGTVSAGADDPPMLALLRKSLSIDDLSKQVTQNLWFAKMIRLMPTYSEAKIGEATVVPSGVSDEQGSSTKPTQLADSNSTVRDEFGLRADQRLRASGGPIPREDCELAELVWNSLYDFPPDGLTGEEDPDEELGVRKTLLMPVWLHLADLPQPLLAFVRQVDVRDDLIYQGFLIDWARLSNLMLADVRDLFPSARLVRADQGPVAQTEAMMTTIPAVLDAGEGRATSPSGGWNFLHTSLVLAWVASITVLAAVGLGMRNLLAFAERRMQFAYAVTHELRTPLTTLRLYTDLLAQGLVKDENTRREYLETVNRETERLSDLVAGVLEYARVENHSVTVERRPIPIGELVEAARLRCEPACARVGQKLVADVDGLSAVRVETDQRLLLQIIDILVDNACKYGHSDDDPSVVIRALRQPDGRLALEVEDHGPGVPSRVRRAIFRPFRRGGAPDTPQTTGIGLGLALARRWARLLGGRVELVNTSPESRGACFRFTFPSS